MKKIIANWRRLVKIGTEGTPVNTFTFKIKLVNALAIIILLINLVVGLPCYFGVAHDNSILFPVLLEIVLATLPVYLNYKKSPIAASEVFYFILCAASYYFCSLLGPVVANVWVMLCVLLITASFISMNGGLQIFNYFLAFLVAYGVHASLKNNFIEVLKVDKSSGQTLSVLAFSVIIFLLVLTAFMYGRFQQFSGNGHQTQNS